MSDLPTLQLMLTRTRRYIQHCDQCAAEAESAGDRAGACQGWADWMVNEMLLLEEIAALRAQEVRAA